MRIDWSYPWLWGIELDAYYKSLWAGWWLVTWTMDSAPYRWWQTIHVSFQPGL